MNLPISRSLANDLVVSGPNARRQVLQDASETVRAISLVKYLAKLRQFSQQTKRGARDFEHHRVSVLWYNHSRISLDSGQHGHLTEAGAGLQPADLALLAVAVP